MPDGRMDRQAVTRGAAQGWAGRGTAGEDFFEGTMAGCRPVRVSSKREGGRVEGLSDWTVGQRDEGSERAHLLTVNGTACWLPTSTTREGDDLIQHKHHRVYKV